MAKKEPGIRVLANGMVQARYSDGNGRQYASNFKRKIDAKRWRTKKLAEVQAGTHIEPTATRTTVEQWCTSWLEGYRTRRPKTVRQAEVHLAHIIAEFGSIPIGKVRPSHVRTWLAKLQNQGYEQSYIHALHNRLAQIMWDALHDGIIVRSPCSKRTAPPAGKQRPFVATTEQIWALHAEMPEHLRAAILLGAFAGLRIAEAAGLRVADVDFMRGIINPAVQYPTDPLKTEMSRTPIPIPRTLANTLSAQVARWPSEHLLSNGRGDQIGPWLIDRPLRVARERVEGLPPDFVFRDLRHYYASLLIQSGASVKVVQARLRHAKAATTLDVYGHLWPDTDDATRTAVDAVLDAGGGNIWDCSRTGTNIN